MHRLAPWALATGSGALYFAAFPPLDRGAVAFVCLVPLLLAGRGCSRSRAFVLGWLAGTVGCTALVGGSVYVAARRYFELSPGLALLAGAAAPQLYATFYFGAFALLAREVEARCRGGALQALGIAAAWVACELARTRIGDGMPWVLLAHSQHARPWILQIADLTGAPGVSFVVALVNAALAIALGAALEARDAGGAREAGCARGAPHPGLLRAAVSSLVTAAVLLGATALYGRASLARWGASSLGVASIATPDAASLAASGGAALTALGGPAGDGPAALRVALIQGDLPDAWRYSLAHLPEGVARMRELTAQVASASPDLVVWPENAVSVSVAANPSAFAPLARSLPAGSALLLGAPRAVATDPGRAVVHNSAQVLDAAGRVVSAYDKVLLTPWAEAPPWPIGAAWRRLIPWPAAYTAAREPVLLDVAGRRVGVLICSEAIHASLARRLVRDGAELLINLANDGWFGDQPARRQHLAAVLLRAVEGRRPVLRATTSGITAAIDPRGVVVARAPQDQAAVLVVSVASLRERTVYTRFGDAFGWACVALLGALLLAPGRRRGNAHSCTAVELASSR